MPILPIDLNTNVQDALQTRAEVIAAAQNAGHAVDAAEIKLLPASGLLRLELTTSTDLNQNVIDAINANNGAAKVGPSLPDPAFFLDIEDIALSGTILLGDATFFGAKGVIRVGASAPVNSGLSDFSDLVGNGTVNNFLDSNVNPLPGVFTHGKFVVFNRDFGGPDVVIPVGTMTITHDGGTVLSIIQVAAITVPPPPTAGSTFLKFYWIDVAGNIYLEREDNPSIVTPFFDYETAFRNGAV